MEFTFEELVKDGQHYFCLETKNLKNLSQLNGICVGFDELNLGTNLYGPTKKETILKQKENQKIVIKVYKRLVKLIKKFKHANKSFNGTIYVERLQSKQNSNDLMLKYMLEVRFNHNFFSRLTTAVDYASKYLDYENEHFKMCDFKDNKCSKHRDRGFNTCSGCCPTSCKFFKNGPCTTENLSCKLIMCDYLEKLGFYFSPNLLPILKVNLCYLERMATWGMFFKSKRHTHVFIWIVRSLIILAFITLVIIVYGLFKK